MSVSPIDSQIWGAMYGSDEMRALFDDRAQVQAMLDFESALARVESRLGIIPALAADQITRAARAVDINLDALASGTAREGYPVVALVAELVRVAGAGTERWIHLGATTQDVLDTAAVLSLRKAFGFIRRDLIALGRALAARAIEHRGTPMAGRTHLQHAVPIPFGLKCAGWAAPIVRHVERIDGAAPRMFVLQFGGAAGSLAALGSRGLEVAIALATELNLEMPALPWHSARDGFAEAAEICALICGSLEKFALDITLMMQTEVGELAESSDHARGGSSTMPQKRNPIAAEYIIAAARGVRAADALVIAAMPHDHERATGAWQAEPLGLPACLVLTGGALMHAKHIAESMTTNPTRMRANLEAQGGAIMAESIATALAPAIGRRSAHEIAARAADAAIQSGRRLRDVLHDDAEVRSHLSAQQIDRACDPTSYFGSADAFIDRVVAAVQDLK
jgi:3-carboxy-cis,cis-muconate cycloisomerase